MKTFLKFLLFTLVFVGRLGFALAQELHEPLFLSFEQRVLISYALLAQGATPDKKSEIATRAQALLKKNYDKGVQTVEVKNFEEFLEKYRGNWPNTNSLEQDLNLIENQEPRGFIWYKSSSERIQRKIYSFIKRRAEELIGTATIHKDKIADLIKIPATEFLQFTPELVQKIAVQESAFEKAATTALELADKVLSKEMSQLNQLGNKLSQIQMGSKMEDHLRIALQTVFSEYFSRLSPESKKQMVSAYLNGDLRASDMEKFNLMVQNSGPQLQKMLQVVASQANLPDEVKEIFKKLESSVRPVPWIQVEKLLEAERQNYDFVYFERKPLGIGSMAQVHRAKIRVGGKIKNVVVRFIKPGIDQRIMEDHKILTEVAAILDSNLDYRKTGAPQLGPVVSDITETVTAELSQEETIERQLKAQVYNRVMPFNTPEYKTLLDVHVPELFLPKGKVSKFMVQELIIGSKLDKEAKNFADIVPGLKLGIAEAIARVWIDEVLFKSGFYHADLHQGNFIVRVTDPKIRLNILDFGMGGTITKELQNQALALGTGVDFLNDRLIANAFWSLSEKSKNKITESQFSNLVSEKIKRMRSGQEPLINLALWTSWAMDHGIGLPYDFVNLNRGFMIVSKLLEDAGSKQTLYSITKKLSLLHPWKVYNALTTVGQLSAFEIASLGLNAPPKSSMQKPNNLIPASNVRSCRQVFMY